MQFLLGEENSFTVPSWLVPRTMKHSNSYIVSLSSVCRWLSSVAEERGVDVFPDTGAAGLLYNGDHVVGVYTSDKGVNKDGVSKEDFQRGYAIHGKMLVLAEGVLGNVTEEVSNRYKLKQGGQRTYGLGNKEVWEIPGCDEIVGKVVHTLGYPLQRSFHDSLLM